MNLNDFPQKNYLVAHEAEQFVLGALLIDNDAWDRVGDLTAAHFYRNDHRLVYAEMGR